MAVQTVLGRPEVPTDSTSCGKENNSALCALADQAAEGYEAFLGRLRKSSTYRKLSEKHATELNAVNGDALREVLRQHLNEVNAAHEHFEQRGKFRRFSKNTIRFLSTFSTYIKAYGGIVEVLRAVGGNYGEAAYKTLSVLLIVAVNKQKKDERIIDVLEQLCMQYSRFEVLDEIHPNSEMKTLLAESYKLGIDFARYATFYYLRSSLGRLWSAIVNPPSVFEERLTKFAKAMEDIRAEGAILDSKRLYKMDQSLEKVEKDIRELQMSQWEARLDKFRTRILPSHPSASQAVNDYEFRLNTTFDGHRQDLTSRLSELQGSEAYQGWSCAQKSSFLLLRGEARCLTHFSWFSPLVLRLFQDFRQAGEAVAFHCCQVMDSGERGDKFIFMLNHLTYQILETMPHALDSTSTKSIWSKIDALHWGRDAALILDVLAEIFSALQKVTLIIDRADLMRGDWEDCIDKFCVLASSGVARRCVVKIILVGSCITNDWRNLKARMIRITGEERVFELHCSEVDW